MTWIAEKGPESRERLYPYRKTEYVNLHFHWILHQRFPLMLPQHQFEKLLQEKFEPSDLFPAALEQKHFEPQIKTPKPPSRYVRNSLS